MANKGQELASDPALRRVITRLADARNVLVLSGAGISAESNIPTFRGKGGLWRSYNPASLATFAAFKKDPKLVWEFYEYRRRVVAEASPNPAHRALAELDGPDRKVFIVTQNIDDLHERAGSQGIVHIHGSIWAVTCLKDGATYEDKRVPLPQLPPVCACGGMLRPGVVWFNEMLPTAPVRQVEQYLHQTRIDVAFVIGTEATFYYIREWAVRAKGMGALLVEINPRRTPLTPYANVWLRQKAGEVLEEIRKALSPGSGS